MLASVLLALADFLACEAALLLAMAAVSAFLLHRDFARVWNPAMAVTLALGVLATGRCVGLYDPGGLSPAERFRIRIRSLLVLPWLPISLVALLQPVSAAQWVALMLAVLLFVPIGPLAEALVRQLLISWSAWGSRAILAGSHETTARLASFLFAHPETGLAPVGFCGTVDGGLQTHPLQCVGSLSDLPRLDGMAETIVVALSPDLKAPDISQLPFRRIIVIPDMAGTPVLSVEPRQLDGSLAFEFSNPVRANADCRAKRVMDLCVAIPLLLSTTPLIVLLALAIKLVSPGPAFYVQRRIGWKGEPVSILKLRSMYSRC